MHAVPQALVQYHYVYLKSTVLSSLRYLTSLVASTCYCQPDRSLALQRLAAMRDVLCDSSRRSLYDRLVQVKLMILKHVET
jgi:hypothetical protein